MSNTIRQSNIFGEYNWKVAYESFLEADYVSYDYERIYESMVDYIKAHYSDVFNDYIRHSEILAHVNMLAYLGQAYAFKNDVNSIENFMDDAKRRQSIINIASTLTYRPSRNIAANGVLKIVSLQTTDDMVDSNGNNLQNRRITWNQKGEPTWYDSFIKILESAFKYENRFGRAFQRDNRDNNRFEVYELNQKKSHRYVYNFKHSIDGIELPYEIVPSAIKDGGLQERTPSSVDPFTIIFKNYGQGNDSESSGFFVQFKQGQLQYEDFHYTTPKIDRSEFIDVPNINDSDVWVQEVNDDGDLIEYWHDIPVQSGQNIIYNEIDLNQRNIYFSKSYAMDKVSILYGDGNFSKSPTNNMRVWFRTSANKKYTIKAFDISNKEISIPYINRQGKQHTLTVFLSNVVDVDNADYSEHIDEIKDNVIANHYQQNRMVTIEDYNIFPYQTNPLRKLSTSNRDNAGKGRFPFLDTHDPTGMHSNLFVNAVDGYLYEEYYEGNTKLLTENLVYTENTIPTLIETLMNGEYFKTFYVNTVFNSNYLNDGTPYTLSTRFPRLYWINRFIGNGNRKGNIKFKTFNEDGDSNWEVLDIDTIDIIRKKSKALFLHEKKEYWTTIINANGEIEISDYVPSNAYLYMIIPSLNTTLSDGIKSNILALAQREESFGLRYDDLNGSWHLIEQNNIVNSNEAYGAESPISTISPDNRWLVKCEFVRDVNENFYLITSRGTRIVFGSEKQVRFFFKNEDTVTDIVTGLPVTDFVNIVTDDENYGVSELKAVHDEYVSTTNQEIEYFDDME